MSTIQNSDAKRDGTKTPDTMAAPKRVDTLSERAMRSCWMPIWRPVVESGNEQPKPASY